MINLYNQAKNINKEQYYKNQRFYRRQKLFKILSFILIELGLLALFFLTIFVTKIYYWAYFSVVFFVRLPITYFKNFDYITGLIHFGISDKSKKKLVIYHLVTLFFVEVITLGISFAFLSYGYMIFISLAIVCLFSIVMILYLEYITYNNSVELIDIDKNLYL